MARVSSLLALRPKPKAARINTIRVSQRMVLRMGSLSYANATFDGKLLRGFNCSCASSLPSRAIYKCLKTDRVSGGGEVLSVWRMFIFENGCSSAHRRFKAGGTRSDTKIRERGQVEPRSWFLKRQKRIRATIPGQAVTPPWQPPPSLVGAFSVHPVE